MKTYISPSLIVGFILTCAVSASPALAKKAEPVAPSPPERAADSEVLDPLEPLNRVIFGLNELIDMIVWRPVVGIWKGVMPQPIQTAVGNAFGNIDDVFGGANQALQGNGHAAADDFGRVVINSTIGIGGLFDVASSLGIQKVRGDFGQTLGVWGVPAGPYLVLPLMGPSNTRETVGRVGRYYTDPRNLLDDEWRYSLMATEYIQARADGEYAEAIMDVSSFDKYVFVRNLYMQRRASLVRESLEAGEGQP